MHLGRKSIIFSVASVLGFVTTVGLAIKETCTIKDNVEYYETDSKKEKAKIIFKTYYPSMITGGLTISSMIFTSKMNLDAQKALTDAYIALRETHLAFKDRVKEIVSEEQYRDICMEEYMTPPIDIPERLSPDHKLFYDKWSNRYFWSDEDRVIEAEYQLNKIFAQQGKVSLAVFYDILRLDRTPESMNLGWSSLNYSSSMWIDFDHVLYPMEEDLPDYILIEPFIEPVENFQLL